MNDLKLFAGYYVYFQENLSDNDKITFFNFIKEATEKQVSHLLITGEMVSEKMIHRDMYPKMILEWSDDVKTVINAFPGKVSADVINALARVINDEYHKGYIKGGTQGSSAVGGLVIAALAITLAAKVYKNYLSKAAKACKGKKGPEKQQCMRQAKMNARKEKIMALTKAQGVCSKTKQPEKCVAGLKLKIAKEKIKMNKIKY